MSAPSEAAAAWRAAALAAVEDLQGESADLGWPEASSLGDALVDALAHLLVDLASGAVSPSAQPTVVGAIGGMPRSLDHASCRACAGSLRRAASVFTQASAAWAPPAGEVALDLADLLDHAADLERGGRLTLGHKGVVLRKLQSLGRRLRELG